MLFFSFPSLLLTLSVVVGVVVADSPFYSIWPVDSGPDSDDNDYITRDLKSRIGRDKIFVSQSEHLGVMYWYVPLSADDLSHYQSLPEVRFVAQPKADSDHPSQSVMASERESGLRKRRDTSPKKPAQRCLKVISTAQSENWKARHSFDYSTVGKDVKRYIIDSALIPDHHKFKDYLVNWRFAGPFAKANEKKDADIGSGENGAHRGTSVASEVLGTIEEGAKKALTVVMCDAFTTKYDRGIDRTTTSAEAYIDGIAKTYDDIKSQKLDGKAVVSVAWAIYQNLQDTEYDDCIRDTFATLLRSLDRIDIPVVAAVDQPAFSLKDKVDTWLQTLSGSAPQLIVVPCGRQLLKRAYEF